MTTEISLQKINLREITNKNPEDKKKKIATYQNCKQAD